MGQLPNTASGEKNSNEIRIGTGDRSIDILIEKLSSSHANILDT